MTIFEQLDFASSLGLKCTMIHCLYNEDILHYFWEKGVEGDLLCEDYCKQIRKVKGLTKNFVVHLNAKKSQKHSLIGLERINKMLKVCEECGVNLCIENLYSETEIPYIFERIKHDKLKICFDVGHKNFLTPEFDLMKEYSQFVEVLHLHDNHGEKDEHLICGCGNIDWKTFAEDLSKVPNVALSAEVKTQNANMSFLKDVYLSLDKMDNI